MGIAPAAPESVHFEKIPGLAAGFSQLLLLLEGLSGRNEESEPRTIGPPKAVQPTPLEKYRADLPTT